MTQCSSGGRQLGVWRVLCNLFQEKSAVGSTLAPRANCHLVLLYWGEGRHLYNNNWQQQGTNFQGVNCPWQDCAEYSRHKGEGLRRLCFFTPITTFQVICLISWPWCTPRRGSSARSRCTWWGGWGWAASSPSAVGTWPGRCGGTAPCSHGTGWSAPGRCCPGTPPRWSWRAHPLLQRNTGHTLLDICKIPCF